tara:strand:- start:10106 stop:10333 length:228 start_codon:yes stop_codon:yes gene_type:complete
MKVKLLVGRAGTGFVQNPGDIIEVPDAEGQRLLDSNQAIIAGSRKGAGSKPVIEAAVKPSPKKRARPKKKPAVNE